MTAVLTPSLPGPAYDEVILTLPCPAAPASVTFAGTTGSASSSWGSEVDLSRQSSGACGAGVPDQLVVRWPIGSAPTSDSNTVTVSPSYDLTGMADGPVELTVSFSAVLATTTAAVSDLTVGAAPPVVAPPAVSTGPVAPVAGGTAETTVADELLAGFVSSTGTTASCTNGGAAILATAADPYDALAASYLEGQLHAGVLITPPSATGAIDPAAIGALRAAGVQRVYVVGGPLAVTPQEIATLESTPAYDCGGVLPAGTTLQVVQAATTGATAVDTAVEIDQYVTGHGEGGVGTSVPGSVAAAFGGGAALDQVGGNGSPAGPAASAVNGVAIVVSSSDWQDAAVVAPIAYRCHLPVVLTSSTTLSPQAKAELVQLGYSQVVVVGGPAVMSPAVVQAIQSIDVPTGAASSPIAVLRVAGADASQTSVDVARLEATAFGWGQPTLYVAQGGTAADGWADALGAAPLAGMTTGGILLTAGPAADLPGSLTAGADGGRDGAGRSWQRGDPSHPGARRRPGRDPGPGGDAPGGAGRRVAHRAGGRGDRPAGRTPRAVSQPAG